jgi:hypothetical protein
MTHKLYVEQENNEIKTITLTESHNEPQTGTANSRESYGLREDTITKMQDIHETIRLYTNYALGAFKELGDAEVEEVTVKFGLKIGGEAGLPILTKASAESNFEIQVKCKFPPKPAIS